MCAKDVHGCGCALVHHACRFSHVDSPGNLSAKTSISSLMPNASKTPSVKWTREHFLIALNLYCKLPFGQLHRNNPIIIDIARKMGRTASSLSMKLCNFAALDPVQQARGVRGLPGVTKQDRAMWSEFHGNLDALATQSEQMLHDLFTNDLATEIDLLAHDKIQLETKPAITAPIGPTEMSAWVRLRRGQQFFRQSVLNAYGVRCCISGINVPSLLVASHIKPWSLCTEERLNPKNGLCLSSIHDAAFDAGLITLDERLNVILSKRLRTYFPQPSLEQNFLKFEGKPIRLPEKLAEPDSEFLHYHRTTIFARS